MCIVRDQLTALCVQLLAKAGRVTLNVKQSVCGVSWHVVTSDKCMLKDHSISINASPISSPVYSFEGFRGGGGVVSGCVGEWVSEVNGP